MTTSQEDKDAIIRQIYYDESGFDSLSNTYKKAHKVLNTITLEDVKSFLAKQKINQKKDYRKYNSYVANESLQEIQIDWGVFTESADENDGYKYLFVASDVFTKYVCAVAIKDKKPAEVVRAMTEAFEKIGVPRQIYHDNEGSFNSVGFIRLINSKNVKQIITSKPPPFVERVIQTLKNMIHMRVEGLRVEKWVELVPGVVRKYNSTKHSTTGLTPNEARDPKNQLETFINIKLKSKSNLRYPKLEVGGFNQDTY